MRRAGLAAFTAGRGRSEASAHSPLGYAEARLEDRGSSGEGQADDAALRMIVMRQAQRALAAM